jgi:hypothetical protein
MGHPAADEFHANPPPIVRETFQPLAALAAPPAVNDTRMFWVERYYNNGDWVQKQATLKATGQHSNIWVMDNESGITTERAQDLARNFDIIYPAETNILGYEYGGGPGGSGGKDGDLKIQILVYDLVNASGVNQAGGYFWGKDYYTQSQLDSDITYILFPPAPKTNLAEIFYLDSSNVRNNLAYATSTLAHEFQHMIHFNRKTVVNGKGSATWYNEMLSLMTEDVMADIIGIPHTSSSHSIQQHIPRFLATYNEVGFTEWGSGTPNQVASSYAKGYTFGAYLMRNYGGTDLLRRIVTNDTVGTDSITAALNGIESGMTFGKALSRFGEAMIFSGNSKPGDALTFDKTVTNTITGYTYTIHAFDIWNTRQSVSGYGPVIFPLTPKDMRPHSVLLHQADSWKNVSGTFSVTLNRPSNTAVEFYLMVR